MSKRANGEGTISQRSSDKRWIGQITLTIEDGKQVRKTVSDKTQSGCKKKLDALKLQFSNKPSIQPKKMTFVQYLRETWLPQKANLEKLKPSTIHTHERRIKFHIEPFFKKTEIQQITVQTLNSFYTVLVGKIAAHTVHKVHNIINNSLKFAVRDGLITHNPATNALLPKFTVKKGSAISSDDIKKLLEAAKVYQEKPTTKSKNVYPLITLAMTTGMRRGELAALQWENVDLDNNQIHIKHSIMEISGKCYLDTTKNESSIRTIHISPTMTDILKAHKVNATGKYVFPSLRDPNKSVMPSRINRFFYNVLKLSSINCKFHSLRHTHITQLLEGGVNLKTIQERVGHTQISTTMIYCHPDKAKDQEAASMFEKFM